MLTQRTLRPMRLPSLLGRRPMAQFAKPAQPHTIDPTFRPKNTRRPLSPDLGVFAFQLPTYMSTFHRLTGIMHVGITYALGLGFLLAPAYFNSDALVSYVESMPLSVTLASKVILAAPWMYHNFNGLRHLVWDAGFALLIPGVYRTGYAVLALTALSTGAVCMY